MTDDAKALRERLESATGERIAAEKPNEATQAMERQTPVMEKS